MNGKADIDKDDIEWLNSFKGDVENYFTASFEKHKGCFPEWVRLIKRFTDAIDTVLSRGRSFFSGVRETHNELCIANAILAKSKENWKSLEYEPPLEGSGKSIDFRAITEENIAVYIDVKTIKPSAEDRWDQYERAVKEGWLPENVEVMLNKKWLGGELWHNLFTARSRMIEYSLELEQKISESKFYEDRNIFLLAFCSNGFSWHHDELEDFVYSYLSGGYRYDDPFSKVQANHMKENIIEFKRNISRFAYMQRPEFDLDYKRLNWNVLPPSDPVLDARIKD